MLRLVHHKQCPLVFEENDDGSGEPGAPKRSDSITIPEAEYPGF
jgi:hypothetical protein